jgi:hypothetical protein
MNTTVATDTSNRNDRLARIAALFLLALTLVMTVGIQRAHATQLTVATPFIDALNDPVEAGAVVDLFGDGFIPGEFVDVEFGGSVIASATADQYGSIYASGVVDPLMPAGAHPLDAVGDLGSWATTDLTVVDPPGQPLPQAQLYPYVGTLQMSVAPGGVVDVLGGDFQPGELVTIEFGGLVLDVVTADANGEFYAVGWIDPLMPDGFHPLDAWGDLGSSATFDLEVWSAPAITPAIFSWGPVPQNSNAVIDGEGFAPFENVWIDFGGLSTPVTADDWGFFTISVFVPGDMPAGAHPVDASGDAGTYATTDQYVDLAVVSKPVTPPATPKAPPAPKAPKAPTTEKQTPPAPKAPTNSESKPVDGADERAQDVDSKVTEVETPVDGDTSDDVTSDEDTSDDVSSDDDDSVDTDETDDESTQESADERMAVDDGGVSLLGAGIAGIALAGATAGAAAMVGRRRR